MITINESDMIPEQKYAEGFPAVGGMMHVTRVTLLTHMTVYRFVTNGWPDDRVYGGPWWFGFSAHDTLQRLAGGDLQRLAIEGRDRLAMLPEWDNLMNDLVEVRVLQPLSAWSGIPRTARAKEGNRYGKEFLTPDRTITQLYVPGLKHRLPDGGMLWTQVLRMTSRQSLFQTPGQPASGGG